MTAPAADFVRLISCKAPEEIGWGSSGLVTVVAAQPRGTLFAAGYEDGAVILVELGRRECALLDDHAQRPTVPHSDRRLDVEVLLNHALACRIGALLGRLLECANEVVLAIPNPEAPLGNDGLRHAELARGLGKTFVLRDPHKMPGGVKSAEECVEVFPLAGKRNIWT